MFGGMKILVSDHWPRNHVGHEVYSYYGHPLYQWAYRLVMRRPVPPTMERGRRIIRDEDPVIYMGHTILCSPRQEQQLKAAIARQH